MNKKRKHENVKYASTPYTQIPDGLWVSPDFNALSPHSRCLFVIMLAKWRPYQPDEPFILTYDEVEKLTRFNRHRISSCIKELMKEGFIEMPDRGRYPNNVTLYTLNKEWISKPYPKTQKSLPEYLRQFIVAKAE